MVLLVVKKNVAILESSYLGSGASTRNTAIIRSNYRTAQGVAFYDESVKLYERLSVDLGFNVLFSQHGHLTLAHTELAIAGLRVRAEGGGEPPLCSKARPAGPLRSNAAIHSPMRLRPRARRGNYSTGA